LKFDHLLNKSNKFLENKIHSIDLNIFNKKAIQAIKNGNR